MAEPSESSRGTDADDMFSASENSVGSGSVAGSLTGTFLGDESENEQNEYSMFVSDFVSAVSNGLVADEVGSKRNAVLKSMEPSEEEMRKAVNVRFALAGDNNTYMQVGVSLLSFNNNGVDYGSHLAPSTLYSADTLRATKEGILAVAREQIMRRQNNAPDELKAVFEALKPLLALEAFKTLFASQHPELQDFVQRDEYDSEKDLGNMQSLLSYLMELLEMDPNEEDVFHTIEREIGTRDRPDASSSISLTRSALLPLGTHVTSAALCDHSPPLSQTKRKGSESTGLPYEVPEMTKTSAALAEVIRRGRVPAPDKTVASRLKRQKVSEIACVSAAIACDGDYVVRRQQGNVSSAWAPQGEYAHDMVMAAAYEHAIHRCTTSALHDATVSKQTKGVLLRTCARMKLKQIPFLVRATEHGASCMLKNGNGTATSSHVPLQAKEDDFEDEGSVERFLNEASKGLVNVTTGVLAPTPDLPSLVSTAHNAWNFLSGVVHRGIYFAFIPDEPETKSRIERSLPSGSAQERRGGIWNEFLRDVAISTDRLWTFVQTLSGVIGDDVESLITTADEASIRASKQIEAQRKQIADRVAQFQSRIIEIVMTSLLKDSTMQMSVSGKDAANSMVVVDKETSKQMKDLASGESGRPFFEANVLLQNLATSSNSKPKKLTEVISSVSEISKQLHGSLNRELLPSAGVAGATLAELSMPRNAYFVKLRNDTTAAIRTAYDRFVSDYNLSGGGRYVWLWELVEGGDPILCTRFAEFVGHVLIQNRTSTGVSAIYTSRHQISVNASQARVSLARLLNQASYYAANVAAPNFKNENAPAARNAYFKSAARLDPSRQAWSSGTLAPFGGRLDAMLVRGPEAHGLHHTRLWNGGLSM